jgi:hypothetical protein
MVTMKKHPRQPSSGLRHVDSLAPARSALRASASGEFLSRPPKPLKSPAPASEGQIPAGEQLLDAKGVGKRMIMSPRTISEMALEGRLPFFRIGIYQRFKWADVEKYLDAHYRVGAPLAILPHGPIEKNISTPHPDPLPARGGEGIKIQRRGA